MPITPLRGALTAAALTAATLAGGVLAAGSGAQAPSGPTFSNPGKIDNPYLPLTKFERCVLRGVAEDGTRERSVKTLQPYTKAFDVGGKQVNAIVIRDNAFEGDALVESTLDYFAMPAKPQLGQQFRVEDVPGITVESDRVEELGLRAKVQGRIVTDAIRIQEFVQPEGDVEYKTYAPGLGVIDEYPPGGHVSFAGCR